LADKDYLQMEVKWLRRKRKQQVAKQELNPIRRAQMDIIKETDLQDADVILYNGNGWISKAIRFFDGTEVNHAGIFMADGCNVGEALGKGLTKRSLKKSIENDVYVIVRRLKTYPGTMQPVIEKAQAYLNAGSRYGYEQILLLAFLCTTRKMPVNKYLHLLIRKVLDEAAALLMGKGFGQPMICSEFVYRCYDEALPAMKDPYSLDISPMQAGLAPSVAATRGFNAGPHRMKMHPDSLLAWAEDVLTFRNKAVQNELVLSFEDPQGKRKISPATKEDVANEALPLDGVIEKYLSETKKPAQRSLELAASMRNAEMLAVIKKFTEAYYQASKKSIGGKSDVWSTKAAEGELPAALAHTLKAVADFVTPADLYNCSDLFSVGKIL
jgi:hypothetical protein